MIGKLLMNETLLTLGTYRFSIDTAAYQTLKRHQSYRWQSQERLLRRPAQQFVGLGDDTITLAGVIYPHYRGGLGQLNNLRKQAESGEPLLLVDGLGFVWGQWVIVSIDETQSHLQSYGMPLKQAFQLQLKYYGDDT
jgi:phage protein U